MSEDDDYYIPLMDDWSVIAPRVGGGMSVVSGALIIYIIMKSNCKLSTVYHRIMFGMAITSIAVSLPSGLTTLLMPRDDESLMGNGLRLGNAATCVAQSYLIYFGLMGTMMYNVSLWIYYCCSIGFMMTEQKIKRCVEPYLHIVPFTIGIVIATIPLFLEDDNAYRASNKRPFCFMQDDRLRELYFGIVFTLLLCYFLVTMVFSLTMIIWRIRKQASASAIVTPSPPASTTPSTRDATTDNTTTTTNLTRRSSFDGKRHLRVILIQASVYLISYTSTLFLWVLIQDEILDNEFMLKAQLFMFELQGFFNFLIFVAHKVYSFIRVRRNSNDRSDDDVDNDFTICEVLKKLFTGYEEPLVFTHISLIQEDRDAARETRRTERMNDEDYDEFRMSSCFNVDVRSGLQIYIGSSGNSPRNRGGDDNDGLSGFEIPSIKSSSEGLSYSLKSSKKSSSQKTRSSGGSSGRKPQVPPSSRGMTVRGRGDDDGLTGFDIPSIKSSKKSSKSYGDEESSGRNIKYQMSQVSSQQASPPQNKGGEEDSAESSSGIQMQSIKPTQQEQDEEKREVWDDESGEKSSSSVTGRRS